MKKVKAEHGVVEISGLGIRLTQMSSQQEIEAALKVRPDLAQFIDMGKDVTPKSEKKDDKSSK